MRKLFLFCSIILAQATHARMLSTKVAYASFYSELEEVLAENYSGQSELNTETGELRFTFPIPSFQFENALMQKHFNEADVMDSKNFPRSKFIGSIKDITKVNFASDGTYRIKVNGNITMKNVTKSVETSAEIKIESGRVRASASFKLDRYEYGITGKEGSISQILEITVKANYE